MSSTHPRLLLLAYPFPPSRAIGAVRCWNMARHLARRGWQVDVVTVDGELLANPEPGIDVGARCADDGIALRRTSPGNRLLVGGWFKLRPWQPRLLAALAQRLAAALSLDPTLGWPAATRRACADLRPGQIDAVLASGPPYSAFAAAAALARRLEARLILDYRDQWTGNPHQGARHSDRQRRREAGLLAAADGVTVVSPSMADSLRSLFAPPCPLRVVTNGYDPDEFAGLEPRSFDEFAIVYAGRFYPPKRTAEPLVAAVQLANSLHPSRPVRLHYYGRDDEHVRTLAARAGADEWVRCHGNVPRREVLSALRGADLGAVITVVTPDSSTEEQGILTGKLFELVGAGARVLLVAPRDSDATRLVDEHRLGVAFPGNHVEAMGRWLATAATRTPFPRRPEATSPLAWPAIAATLDSFLRQLLRPAAPALR